MKTSLNDEITRKIGLKIRLERIKRGWKQDQLAEYANLNKNSISSIERGKISPSISTLANIADAFGITINDLTDVSKVEI